MLMKTTQEEQEREIPCLLTSCSPPPPRQEETKAARQQPEGELSSQAGTQGVDGLVTQQEGGGDGDADGAVFFRVESANAALRAYASYPLSPLVAGGDADHNNDDDEQENKGGNDGTFEGTSPDALAKGRELHRFLRLRNSRGGPPAGACTSSRAAAPSHGRREPSSVAMAPPNGRLRGGSSRQSGRGRRSSRKSQAGRSASKTGAAWDHAATGVSREEDVQRVLFRRLAEVTVKGIPSWVRVGLLPTDSTSTDEKQAYAAVYPLSSLPPRSSSSGGPKLGARKYVEGQVGEAREDEGPVVDSSVSVQHALWEFYPVEGSVHVRAICFCLLPCRALVQL